jgi:hypothetical protein
MRSPALARCGTGQVRGLDGSGRGRGEGETAPFWTRPLSKRFAVYRGCERGGSTNHVRLRFVNFGSRDVLGPEPSYASGRLGADAPVKRIERVDADLNRAYPFPRKMRKPRPS